ncbi:EF-hand domain-containing protein [Hyphococcus sp.]|uniref:EF-hand domain-containing protein n=1 Tax=Hyphococcus sp. TaxID=2038636 RepID=UPI003CCBC057
MKNKIVFSAIAAAGAALLTAGAYAEDGKGRGGYWEKMDTNGDGEITADEASDRFAERLEAADTDGSGGVSKAEMEAYHKARRAERREARNPDKNDDGVVDRTEFVNAAQERFERMDKNGDGVLSEDERRRRGHRGRHRRGGDDN